ncbi:sodium:proton antiporter NhaD [Bacteroidota bacterium]
MFVLMAAVFVLGYVAIALEHPLKVDKAATALLTGTVLWAIYIMGAESILPNSPYFAEFLHENPGGDYIDFIAHHEVYYHLGEISTILFFLLGAMTIVEMVDTHEGFKIITDKIKTTDKIKLMWILSILTFFMSAALDNLTTTIVMVALLRKLIDKQQDRWFMAAMVVLAANAGGAWSPIGDVTTIMLWIDGQVTTLSIIKNVFIPSIVTIVVPLLIVTFFYPKGNLERPVLHEKHQISNESITEFERRLMLIMGVSGLLFVPVFKTVTHLPPYLGMLFSLSIIWITTEILHRRRAKGIRGQLVVSRVLKKVDTPTVLFFLGILTAVSALQSAGHLNLLANKLDSINLSDVNKVYFIDTVIGILSAIVDNVPLVAGAMGMYEIAPAGSAGYEAFFMVDGQFWQFLAYTAGTGGSILIIGSAAGVAAMGMENIDFIWYMKRISLLAMAGYFAGAAVFYLMFAL